MRVSNLHLQFARIFLMNLLAELSCGYRTISISPENLTGEKGRDGATPLDQGSAREAARDLGTGWKVNPYLHIKAGETSHLQK